MGIFDFFRRNKKKAEISLEKHEVLIKKIGTAYGTQKEYDVHTVADLQKHFIAFDVETTGLSPQFNRIVELGAVEFINGIPSRQFSSLVNPGVPIPTEATAVNHITNEMLSKAPTEGEVYPQLIEFLGNALHAEILLCAHNARFDVEFLCNTLSRLGYDAEIAYVDTLALCRKQIKGAQNYKQETVAKNLKIACQESHHAQNDAFVCGQILIRLLETLEETLEQEKRRLDSSIPSEEELEVCAVIQKSITDNKTNASYLRFRKSGDYVNVNCFDTICRFKFAKKGKYIIVLRSVADKCNLPVEACTASEGGAGLKRVYFNNPFTLEQFSEFFSEQYLKKYAEMQEYISYGKSYRQQVINQLREEKQIEPDELCSLLKSAHDRSYKELDVQIEEEISREDVIICANNNRCPLSAIRNINDWDAGFKEGSPYYFEGEEKRKAGLYDEAIRLFDLARYNGYEAPALYESYAKLYRQQKDYENEIVIIEEFLSRKTYGRENEYMTRRNSALKLLYNKQQAEKKAAQKALEKENKRKEKEIKAESAVQPKKPRGRAIIQLNDEGTIINEYESITLAVADTGISSKSIRDAANGVQKHAGGFCWRYKDEYEKEKQS